MLSDNLFWKSLYNTLYYTILAVPIGVVVAMVLALAMNQRAAGRCPFYPGRPVPSLGAAHSLRFPSSSSP